MNVAPDEQATVAEFRLWLDQQNVCFHLRGKKSIDHITLPLYAAADGLAHDWWAIFGGRVGGLSLVKHRSGFAVPDISLSFDGEVFEICARQRSYRNPDVRFWGGPTEVMSRGEAETQLTQFIEAVLVRLGEKNVQETALALRWARVQASRQDPDESVFCEAAGALSVDPYQIDNSTAETIENASQLFEGEPLTEFLAGARLADRRRLLDWVDGVEKRPRYAGRVPELRAAAEAACKQAPCSAGEKGWSLGYRRARAMRQVLGLKEDIRFRSFHSLAQAFGAKKSYALAPSVDGIRLLRSDRKDSCYLHLRTHGTSTEARASHIFSFARGVADVACFPAPQRSPVNDVHYGYRQAAGRAFAAEFLAPVSEVQSMSADGRDIVSIADEFGVSTAVIGRQLENAQRIAETCDSQA